MSETRTFDEDPQEAQIRQDLEQAVRTGGVSSLIAELARLSASVGRLEESTTDLGTRAQTIEAALGALHIPIVASSVVEGGAPSEITITADMPLDPADGFHTLEYDGLGRPFRWTGATGNTFRVALTISRSTERTARLALWPFGRSMADEPTSIACEIDGIRAIAKRSAVIGDDAVFEVVLPADPTRKTTVLSYEVPTGPPENAEDEREIGVPFRYLQVS